MGEKQFQITDEFDDCFYIREKDNEALTTAKDFENKLNEQNETIKKLEKENTELRMITDLFSDRELRRLQKENEQLKKELKKYTDAFDCSQCRFQNYDWFDDGDEFEVCEKGNNEAQMENHSCSEWEEL